MNIAFAGDMRAHQGYIIADGAIKQGVLTQEQVDNYNNALEAVKTAEYKDAAAVLLNEHNNAIDNMHGSIDVLVTAATALSEVAAVADMASKATTTNEQNEFKDYVVVNDVSLTDEKVDNFNTAIAEVESYAQQAGAFLAAANNSEVTNTIDTYAANSGIAVSSYTAITYTQSMDQFVVSFDNGYVSVAGYTSDNFVTAEELYAEASVTYTMGRP
jgi:hypothetical protein